MKGISGKEHLTDVNGLDVQTFLYSFTSHGLGVTKPRASSFFCISNISAGPSSSTSEAESDATRFSHLPLDPGHHHLWLDGGRGLLPGLSQKHNRPTSGCLCSIPDVPATLGSSPNITTRPTYRNSLLYSVTLQIKAIAPKLVILKISFRKGSSGS